MARRLGAVVAGILILVLLVLGIRGCLNARKERAFRKLRSRPQHARPAVAARSARGSSALLRPCARPAAGETDIRADRSAADGVVSRAESLDPPGELSNAQDDVVEAFQLRADGLADRGPGRPGTRGRVSTSYRADDDRHAGLSRQRRAVREEREEINAVLQQEGIDEDVPRASSIHAFPHRAARPRVARRDRDPGEPRRDRRQHRRARAARPRDHFCADRWSRRQSRYPGHGGRRESTRGRGDDRERRRHGGDRRRDRGRGEWRR